MRTEPLNSSCDIELRLIQFVICKVCWRFQTCIEYLQFNFNWLTPEPNHKLSMTQFQKTTCIQLQLILSFLFVLIIWFRTRLKLDNNSSLQSYNQEALRSDIQLSQHLTEDQSLTNSLRNRIITFMILDLNIVKS